MYHHVKRTADVAVSLLLLVLLSPLLVVIAVWIKLESAGPIMFKQLRYGRNKVPFQCLKFRTMHEDAPSSSPTRSLKNSHNYITFSGKVLRRLGLDELPQLVNILRGDMSLIGPRPVILAEKDLIRERDKYGANAMTPGIGGWAQSNGRDTVGVKEKARLDGEYAQNFGWQMDISCIWRTAVAIFTSEGFKEGGFGDTPYRREVANNTHKVKRISFVGRVVRRVKRDLGKAKRPLTDVHGTSGKKVKS
ncbi:sugar transferase [Candidatus Saccharibacteria bacterium]|jgi:O-antigen biosynthesis protein WbqP|nr:sugar transferase [Candidatus Saccharibacteria bacterium]